MARTIAVLLLTLLWSEAASAQRCSGNPSFTGSPFHFAANLSTDRLAGRYTGEIRARIAAVFAAVDAGVKTWSDASFAGESNELGLAVGLQLPRGRESKLELCPLLSWATSIGPDNTAGGSWTYNEKSLSVKLSAGYLLTRNKTWDVVPTATLAYGTTNAKLTTVFGGNRATFGSFCCGRRSLATVSLGIGFGFAQQAALIPSVDLPLTSNRETTYSLRLALRLSGL
jgi:hypothetical protein